MSSARPRFEPIGRQTVSEGIRDALAESIRSGALPPGSRLPSERSLCEEFGVARTSVREAIQGLVSLGAIVKRANRPYVAEQLPGMQLAGHDDRKRHLEELVEVRRLVEIPIARLAATRAGADDRTRIRSIARSISPDMSLADYRRSARAFHVAVARACGNETLAELYGKVLDAQFDSSALDSLLDSSSNVWLVKQVIFDSAKAYNDIADAIVEGNADRAIAAVERHLSQVERQLIARIV
ncbi:MAG: GntR family transcriptional regulator, transcriptional repressor for pyruvate dehydrogenase complex [Actinomycetota bacterium]|nr:GntR family transcriptional regulator, transcriptional repressor for pyruvate dehydrogenase complex [Actinomycetota bacterium]